MSQPTRKALCLCEDTGPAAPVHTCVSPRHGAGAEQSPSSWLLMARAWATPKARGLPDLEGTKVGCCGVGKHAAAPTTLPGSSEHRRLPGEPMALVLCEGMWQQEVLVGSSSDGVWRPSASPPLRGMQLGWVPSHCLVSCPESSQCRCLIFRCC